MVNNVGNVTIGVAAEFAEFVSGLTKAQAEAEKWARNVQNTIKDAGDRVGDSLRSMAAAVGIAFSVEKLVEFGKAATDNAEKVQ